MKNNKKPFLIILTMFIMVVLGLLLAYYMFKQVDINLEKNETTQQINEMQINDEIDVKIII